MSDRIAVFSAGRIEQIGTPREVYENPASTFVANFLGVSNLISGPAAQELLGSDQMVNIRPENELSWRAKIQRFPKARSA